jgi:hypothetical protein
MTVRVLRLLEYVYPDHETAEFDMKCWQTPADGVHTFGDNLTLSSTTMMPRTVAADEVAKPSVPLPTIEVLMAEEAQKSSPIDSDNFCCQAGYQAYPQPCPRHKPSALKESSRRCGFETKDGICNKLYYASLGECPNAEEHLCTQYCSATINVSSGTTICGHELKVTGICPNAKEHISG